MPIQAPQWTEFLCCPLCCHEFDGQTHGPVSLACGHTLCRGCLASLHMDHCPFDQSLIRLDVAKVPLNSAILRLVGVPVSELEIDGSLLVAHNVPYYRRAVQCIEDLATFLPHFSTGTVSVLSRPMQRKLVTLLNCQLLECEGRARSLRAVRSLGERTVTELLLYHQNPQQLSANLWAAVRARGCQFLGPAMQEEVLKLVLLALEDGVALSRKVLVMFVVQRLEPHYSQASKTSIGHVVQLLYRASCFKVSKREGDSSLMQLKEEFRCYEALRKEHDAQIVQIANEAGLRIAPDQWSSLLYGDTAHKSHMQSIMDKLQTPQSFSQSIQELTIALQRTGDPSGLGYLRPYLEILAGIDHNPEVVGTTWTQTADALEAAREVVSMHAEFITAHNGRRPGESGPARHKIGISRDIGKRGRKPEPALPVFDKPPPYFPPPPLAYASGNRGYLWYLEKERFFGQNGNSVMLPVAGVTDPLPLLNRPRVNFPEVQNLAYETSVSVSVLNMNVTWRGQPHGTDQNSMTKQDHFFLPPLSVDPPEIDQEFISLEKRMEDIHVSDSSADSGKNFHFDSEHVSTLEDSLQEEELYEAGIEEDMRVLEERWESELAEQERRWSESHS